MTIKIAERICYFIFMAICNAIFTGLFCWIWNYTATPATRFHFVPAFAWLMAATILTEIIISIWLWYRRSQ